MTCTRESRFINSLRGGGVAENGKKWPKAPCHRHRTFSTGWKKAVTAGKHPPAPKNRGETAEHPPPPPPTPKPPGRPPPPEWRPPPGGAGSAEPVPQTP